MTARIDPSKNTGSPPNRALGLITQKGASFIEDKFKKSQPASKKAANLKKAARFLKNRQTGVRMLWEFQTGNQIHSAPCVGQDGAVYLGSGDKNIYALDFKTGQKRWEFKTGGRIYNPPVAGPDDTVYTASGDKNVYAIDGKTGKEKWRYPTKGTINASPLLGDNGVLYISGSDGKFHALDAKTGEKRWEFDTGKGKMIGDTAAFGPDNTVIFGNHGHRVYSLDADTGEKKWEKDAGWNVNCVPAVTDDGNVIIATTKGKVMKLDGKTGNTMWKQEAGDMFEHSGTPVLSKSGIVYYPSHTNFIYALNEKTGEVRWKFKSRGKLPATPVLSDDEKTLYVGSFDSKLYALNAKTGGKRWSFTAEDGIVGVSKDPKTGAIFAGADNGKLYVIKELTVKDRKEDLVKEMEKIKDRMGSTPKMEIRQGNGFVDIGGVKLDVND